MNLADHSGIVMGVTERGITRSLLRLASLAIQHQWNVVVFDPRETQASVFRFTRSMHAAGCTRLFHFSDTGPQTPVAPENTSPADDQFRQGVYGNPWTQRQSAFREDLDTIFPLAPRPLGEQAGASALYLGFNVWKHPRQARQQARVFLAEMLAYLSEQSSEVHPLLLLIKHPELLFTAEQILPLYSFMEQGYGSAFVGLRSLADVSSYDTALLENARTVIAHRSHPSWELKRRVALAGWHRSLRFSRIVCALPHNECFVLHAGQAAHIRVTGGEPEEEVKRASVPVDGLSPTCADPSTDDDVDIILASLFGPANQEADVVVPSHELGRTRSLGLYSPDQAHLRRALWLLGQEGYE